MDADLDTLATALYVKIDDLLTGSPHRAPWRPQVGLKPQISDAEVATLCVMQALLSFTSEARWLRHARKSLRHLFPYLPKQPGYNKRLRKLTGTVNWLIRQLAMDTSLWSDDVWVVDSTPIECARSRDTVRGSDLAGWAEYGYCASHSRYFWGLRLHLVATLHGLPIAFALTGAKADERQVLLDLLGADPDLVASRAGQTLIADKNYYGGDFEADLTGGPGRCQASAAAPGPQGRTRTRRPTLLQTPPPDHRVDHRHRKRPARPGTPRRTHPHRRPDPHPATSPGPDRSDLAQRQARPTRQTITPGLRPLKTPWNRSSSGGRRAGTRQLGSGPV